MIFGFRWLGGSASDVASETTIGGPYHGFQSRSAGSAIFVAPDGLPDASQNNNKGWPNTNGQDAAFVKAMLQLFESNLCVDQSRIFSTGFSYGGTFSLTGRVPLDVEFGDGASPRCSVGVCVARLVTRRHPPRGR